MDRAGELFEAQLSVLTTRNGEASKAWSAVGTQQHAGLWDSVLHQVSMPDGTEC